MKLTFVSNYFNHHQRPLCRAFAQSGGVDFVFYQTEDMEEERVRMGWGLDIAEYPYVKLYREDEEAAQRRIFESDVVIWGGVEMEDVIEPRLQAGKLTFRYSERLYKEGQWKFISPRGLKKKYHDHTRYRKAPVYLLCAGAYVGSDFALVGAYPEKKFVWGYFPEAKHYDIDELLAKKSREGEPLRLLWSGRMIDWKHPEYALAVAEYLKQKGTPFSLNMVGGGELEESLRRAAEEKGLSKELRFCGFLKPEEVREEMERADIFLFSSDQKEGWGAVLNEAMNSACLVVARPMIGAVPYLLQHGCNGMVCGGDVRDYCRMVHWLAEHRQECAEQGRQAYETITRYWNAENAAEQFLRVAQGLLAGKAVEYSSKEEITGALQPMCRDPQIGPHEGGRFVRRY